MRQSSRFWYPGITSEEVSLVEHTQSQRRRGLVADSIGYVVSLVPVGIAAGNEALGSTTDNAGINCLAAMASACSVMGVGLFQDARAGRIFPRSRQANQELTNFEQAAKEQRQAVVNNAIEARDNQEALIRKIVQEELSGFSFDPDALPELPGQDAGEVIPLVQPAQHEATS